MGLEFIKQKKSQGICEETGYYFKKEFLSKYKTKAIEILRKRVKDAGDGDFIKGKDIAVDEWEVINKEYIKSCEAIKKTNQTKKPYWDKIRKRTLQRRIVRLGEKINDMKERKKERIWDFDERINKIYIEIDKIKKEIKENQNGTTTS